MVGVVLGAFWWHGVDHQGYRLPDPARRADRLHAATHDLPADTVTALQDALTPYCDRYLNGDGKVVVQVDTYNRGF